MQTLQELNAGKLKGSKRIKISAGLNAIPSALYELADTLEVLDLSDNDLRELPADFAKFQKLRIAFFFNNAFERLPEVLGECPNLEMVGFKSNRIRSVPAESLAPKLRWLILTDNRIDRLPDCFDKLPHMQKLMLAGNQLQELPESLSSCKDLQLIRVSANQMKHFPQVLTRLPNLAWCAVSGNPFSNPLERDAKLNQHALDEFELQDLLGQGASGKIYLAHQQATGQQKAVKIFKGGVTSDGYPQDEMQACITAGAHPNLVNVEAKIEGESSGLVMELIPDNYINLGLPPSLESCTRDCFEEELSFNEEQLVDILQQAVSALLHLHEQGLVHGDFYAHNVLINNNKHILLGDFGAASHLQGLPLDTQQALMSMEKRALAHFMEDMWQQTMIESALLKALQAWHNDLLQDRISLSELLVKLEKLSVKFQKTG